MGRGSTAPAPWLCLASAAQVPGECSFLQSPSDLQVPSRSPVGCKLSCWQCREPELWVFFPLLFRWWAVFSWHRNIGREGMPRLRSWHGGDATLLSAQCSSSLQIHLTWHLHSTPGQKPSQGDREGSTKAVHMSLGWSPPSRHHLVPFLFSEEGRDQEREKGRSMK